MEQSSESSSQSVLASLWERMNAQGEFPALARSVGLVVQLAESNDARVDHLASVILRDVSLASRILRLANSATYRRSGMPEITTVSRALVLLGLETVRNLALTSVVLQRLGNAQGTIAVEWARALVSALFAEQLAPSFRIKGERAFLSTLFRHLGRLLIHHYFSEEAAQIQALVAAGMSEAKAEYQVLGVHCATFSLFVAKAWGLPLAVQQAIAPTVGAPPVTLTQEQDAVRWLTAAAEAAGAQLAQGKTLAALYGELTHRYPFLKSIDASQWQASTKRCEAAAAHWWQALVGRGDPFAVLAEPQPQLEPGRAASWSRRVEPSEERAAAAAEPTPASESANNDYAPDPQTPVDEAQAMRRILVGIEEYSQSLLEGQPWASVAVMACEIAWRALRYERILLFLCEGDRLVPAFGIAPEWRDLRAALWHIPLSGPGHVFQLAVARGLDIEIEMRSDPAIAAKFPDAMRRLPRGESVLLLPLRTRDETFGLAYLDKPLPRQFQLSPELKRVIRLWRNQVALGWAQARTKAQEAV
ncbi:HDOD domain-containing protein [Hydrogenophilus thermoluteolus]|uniref:HDOD domain-containing protein n=1 Tax=Hydrogenophilus thermoluteolus TaxID=297 RepID=UPI003F660E7A